MARYTEGDIQNALADLRNGVTLATATTNHGVLRNTLCGRKLLVMPQHTHNSEQSQPVCLNKQVTIYFWEKNGLITL